jgi:hypothetical protein
MSLNINKSNHNNQDEKYSGKIFFDLDDTLISNKIIHASTGDSRLFYVMSPVLLKKIIQLAKKAILNYIF